MAKRLLVNWGAAYGFLPCSGGCGSDRVRAVVLGDIRIVWEPRDNAGALSSPPVIIQRLVSVPREGKRIPPTQLNKLKVKEIPFNF